MSYLEELKKQQEEAAKVASTVDKMEETSELVNVVDSTTKTIQAVEKIKAQSQMSKGVTKVDVMGSELVLELSDEDLPMVATVANTIELGNNNTILALGSDIQKSMVSSSDSLLAGLKITDTGDISEDLIELMNAIKGKPIEETDTFLRKFFKKLSNKKNEIAINNMDATDLVDEIVDRLELKANALLSDNVYLEELHDGSKQTFHDLTITIKGAMQKHDELVNVLIPELVIAAENGGDEALNALTDAQEFVNRLERKIADLNLTRTVTNQSKAQIRLIQNTNHTLAEKINSSITSAVPLWKQQLATGAVLERQRAAVEAQKEVSNVTNSLLKKNADMLHISSVETAKENERGVIDLSTLEYTQQKLIDTVTETMKIQREGSIKRKESQDKLDAMTDNLKVSLLEAVKADEVAKNTNAGVKPRKKVN